MLDMNIEQLKKETEYGQTLLKEEENITKDNVDNLEITRRIENLINYAAKAGQNFIDINFTGISDNNINTYLDYFKKKGFSTELKETGSKKKNTEYDYIRISWE